MVTSILIATYLPSLVSQRKRWMAARESQKVNIIREVKMFSKAVNYQVEVDLRIVLAVLKIQVN